MAKGKKTGGRQKGTPNKMSKALKDMILSALDKAGGERYLLERAKDNPKAFLALLGRVLPTQVTGDDGGPVEVEYRLSREVAEKLNEVLDPQAGE